MKVDIPFGKNRNIQLDISDRNIKELLYPNSVEIKDSKELICNAINNPLGTEPFYRWIEKKKDVLFVVNDATRPTPTAKILEILSNYMNVSDARFIIAGGTHRKPDREELEYIFSKLYNRIETSNILFHDAEDYDNMVNPGRTDSGTDVWINKNIFDAGCIIPLGSVEPHYMGGFTGGRKFFVPGLAGYKTCEQNHKLAMEPGAEALKLRGNPVHEDFISALQFLPDIPVFSIQTVVDKDRELYAVTAGDIIDSHYKAAEYAKDVFCVKIREKAAIVVAVATYPMDINLYQAHKTIEHARLALRDNGILILISECRDGIGPEKFYDFLSSSDSPDTVIKKVRKEYKLGYHKAARMAELLKVAEIWTVCDIKESILRRAFLEPFNSLQEAINKAIKIKGDDVKILFLMDGSLTLPLYE